MTAERRYPGSRPFQDTPVDRMVFRGREDEKKALLHLILAENPVLLYAKSGMGKTSLLNAGILQQLREREFFPFMIRLNQPAQDLSAAVREQIKTQAGKQGLEVEIERESEGSLWRYFHALRLWQGDVLMTPVLIFDQFEELFTIIPELPRRKFLREFASLARRTRLEPSPPEDAADTPAVGPPLKMVLSIREDYLGELEQVAHEVPTVMHHRFRLTSLTREQARSSIQEPAALEAECIPGKRFDYEPAAIEEMLNFLCTRRLGSVSVTGNEVEPFQLQILCRHIEENVLARQRRATGVLKVRASDLGGRGGMEAVLQEFYNHQINQVPEAYREAVRRLCERGLISETEKRLSLEEEDIARRFEVGKAMLENLVDLRLIRAEPRVGSIYYELSHDTLVAPILRDRNSRDPEAILRDAEALRIAGDYSRAYHAYERVLQLDPRHELAHVQYASLLLQLGRTDRAVDVLTRASDAGMQSTSLYQLLGEVQSTRGDYKKAIRAYQAALKLNDNLASVHTRLGDAYRLDGESERAVEAYERAVALDRNNPNAYQQLGLLYIGKGKPEQALDVFRHAIEINHEFAYIFEELVKEAKARGAQDTAKQLCKIVLASNSMNSGLYFRVAYELGELQEFAPAAEACEKSASLDPTEPATYNNWGYYLSRLERFEEAIRQYLHSLQVDPKYGRAYRNWTDALWKLDRKQEALRVYEEAVAADPGDAENYVSWGVSLGELGRHEEAIGKYSKASELRPGALVYNNWGAMLVELGRMDEAVAKYRQAVETDPKYGRAYRNWADALWKLDRKEDALGVYEKAVTAISEDPENYVNWGLRLGELGRHEEAIEKYRRATELRQDAIAHNNWGVMLAKLGRLNEAIEQYGQALEVDPKYGRAYRNWADALWKLDRREESLGVYEKAIAADPSDAEDYVSWGWRLGELGRHEEAIEKYGRATELRQDAIALNNWGSALVDLGRFEEAVGKYRQSVDVDPKYGDAFRNWAGALWKLDRKEEALGVYEKATAAVPAHMAIYGDWGWALSMMGRRDEAIAVFRRASEIEPNHSETYRLWARVLFDDKRHEEAFALYQKATEADAKNANSFCDWGWSLLRIGRYEDAVEKLRRALEINPRLGAAWGSAAEALAELGRTGEALQILAEAVASGPTSSEDFTNLGWGFFTCGHYEKSIEWTRKAVSLDKDSMAAQCNLALASLHLGSHEAGQQYQEAIEKARRLRLPEELKLNAIRDLGKALEKNPGLANGEEMLAMVQQAYEEMTKPRE